MTNKFLTATGFAALCFSGPSAIAQELRGSIAPGAVETSGWYLRGDAGLNAVVSATPKQSDLAANGGRFLNHSLTNTASFGAGVGYRVNENVRFDATWELRTASNLKATTNVRILNARGQLAADIYSLYDGNLGSQVGLLNAYYDFANWRGFTPFVGVSAGLSRNTVSGLTTTGHSIVNIYSNVAPFNLLSQITENTGGYAPNKTKYSFAWGLTAGVGYAINDKLTLEAAYRYLNLGSGAATSVIQCTCGTTGQPIKIGTLASHDLKFGMRWNFNEPTPVVASRQPLVTKY